MAVDPRVEANKYLEQHKITQLFETLTAQLLFNKPENPRQFLIKYLENVKVSKAQPLLTANDLSTMFAMFDVTNRGVVTAEQANNALRTILGPDASLAAAGVEHGDYLKEPEFTAGMLRALQAAMPDRRS